MDLYIDGASLQTIEEETGVHKTRIKRLVERCTKIDTNEKMCGYKSLIPWKNIGKGNGSFNKLLITYPSLQQFIFGNIIPINRNLK